jgi:hypothetical protein
VCLAYGRTTCLESYYFDLQCCRSTAVCYICVTPNLLEPNRLLSSVSILLPHPQRASYSRSCPPVICIKVLCHIPLCIPSSLSSHQDYERSSTKGRRASASANRSSAQGTGSVYACTTTTDTARDRVRQRRQQVHNFHSPNGARRASTTSFG